MWVLTLNYSASMHDAMTNLTGIVTKSSEQHTDFHASRRKRDKKHGLKFTAWLQRILLVLKMKTFIRYQQELYL